MTEVPAEASCPLVQAINQRRSNRSLVYRGPKLTEAERNLLAGEAGNVKDGTVVDWLDERTRRAAAVRVIQAAETERFLNRALHAELFGTVRFDAGWSSSVDQGLAPRSLGMGWLERPMFQLLRYWPL